VLKSALAKAKLGRDEELSALRRLDAQARAVEGLVSGPGTEAFIARERQNAPLFGGRSVFGWETETGTARRIS
jgi:hypothetical protein